MEENVESSEIKERRSSKKPSTSFIITMTALLSISLTLFAISIINGGIIVFPKSMYGDMSKVAVIGEISKIIDTEFYGEKPTEDEIIAAAAKGAVETLNDPYAQYFTEEEYKEYSSQLSGSYSGLGISLKNPDEVGSLIVQVYKESPAGRAGLMAGDIITHVDGVELAGMSKEDFSLVLKGEAGEKVTVFVLRDTTTLEFTMEYGEVTAEYVSGKMLDNNIAYMYIDMFSGNAAEQFGETYKKLTEENKVDGLIIDLRNNPGGSLTTVINIADQILGEGIIVQIGSSMDDPRLRTYSASDEHGAIAVPITVLVNENSASASEILAATLQENEVGVIVGTVTYGKGIVQTTMPLVSMKAWLKLTTDGYYTPNGNSIHGKGVTPDIVVELTEDADEYEIPNLDVELDTQLQRAIEDMKNRIDLNA